MKTYILALVVLSVGCSNAVEPTQEVSQSSELVPVCTNHCGETIAFGSPPNQCYCDASCDQLGDCCPGFWNVCGCQTHCGNQHPNGCFCDATCANVGDCCPLKDYACGRSLR